MAKKATETIHARGHPNVSATHRTTLEITTREDLTIRGDCIVAVCADKGAKQLSESFKELAKKENSTITMILKVNNQTETIKGQGSPHLTFTHPHDIVARKSTYHSDRTIMIKANKAALDLNRELVQKLKDPQTKVEITLIAEAP